MVITSMMLQNKVYVIGGSFTSVFVLIFEVVLLLLLLLPVLLLPLLLFGLLVFFFVRVAVCFLWFVCGVFGLRGGVKNLTFFFPLTHLPSLV